MMAWISLAFKTATSETQQAAFWVLSSKIKIPPGCPYTENWLPIFMNDVKKNIEEINTVIPLKRTCGSEAIYTANKKKIYIHIWFLEKYNLETKKKKQWFYFL